MDFDDLTTVFVILDEGVESFGFLAMLRQELLNVLVVKQILLCQSKNLESLLFGHESTLDSETLLCYFLTMLIAVFDIRLS